jgi:hypothetical protein
MKTRKRTSFIYIRPIFSSPNFSWRHSASIFVVSLRTVPKDFTPFEPCTV